MSHVIRTSRRFGLSRGQAVVALAVIGVMALSCVQAAEYLSERQMREARLPYDQTADIKRAAAVQVILDHRKIETDNQNRKEQDEAQEVERRLRTLSRPEVVYVVDRLDGVYYGRDVEIEFQGPKQEFSFVLLPISSNSNSNK